MYKTNSSPVILIFSNSPVLTINNDDLKKNLDCSIISMPLNSQNINHLNEVIPDITFIDVKAYNLELRAFIQEIRDDTVNPILLICNEIDENQSLDAYSCGVDEVIQKEISTPLFIAKIKAWFRRTWTIPTNAIQTIRVEKCMLVFSDRTFNIENYPPIRLTNLELRLLHLLMSREPNVVDNEEIIGRVWGYSNPVDIGALKNTVYRLRKKIGKVSQGSCKIQNLPGLGYKFKVYRSE